MEIMNRILFTFQYGRLKTSANNRIVVTPSRFTFQYGRLKTMIIIMMKIIKTKFTFQYGRLKTKVSNLNTCS